MDALRPMDALGSLPNLLRNSSEVTVLRKSFDALLVALGNDREAVTCREGSGLR